MAQRVAPRLPIVPSLENCRPQPRIFPERENTMKYFKNLSACNDLLKQLQALNERKPEASSKLERARRKLNRLKRSGAISQEEVFEAVREVAEAVLKCTDGKQ